MLQRLTKPQPIRERGSLHYIKCLIAGCVVARVFYPGQSMVENESLIMNSVKNIEELSARNDINFNKSALRMLGSGVRFAFYDIFKRFLSAGIEQKWRDSLRWFTYGVSAIAAQFLAVTVSFPFDNVKIFIEKSLPFQQIQKLRPQSNQSPLREIFPNQMINPENLYYKAYRQSLLRNLPCTTVTLTTFQIATEIWYDYVLRTPKQQFNGINQSLFSFVNGSIAGASFFGATKLFSNLQLPAFITTPKNVRSFYIVSVGLQFTAYNFIKILLNDETLGQGQSSKKY